jgi:hypothetical protein
MAIVVVINLPESLLVSLSILMASFYKNYHWPWPLYLGYLWAGCSCGLEEPLVLVRSS